MSKPVHGERKAFAAVTAPPELLWHSEHKERGESRDSELPLHTSLISWHKRSITSGNSMPPAQPPNPPGKERSLHLTNSAQRLHLFLFLCSGVVAHVAVTTTLPVLWTKTAQLHRNSLRVQALSWHSSDSEVTLYITILQDRASPADFTGAAAAALSPLALDHEGPTPS